VRSFFCNLKSYLSYSKSLAMAVVTGDRPKARIGATEYDVENCRNPKSRDDRTKRQRYLIVRVRKSRFSGEFEPIYKNRDSGIKNLALWKTASASSGWPTVPGRDGSTEVSGSPAWIRTTIHGTGSTIVLQ
jgi:hypothetical protein